MVYFGSDRLFSVQYDVYYRTGVSAHTDLPISNNPRWSNQKVPVWQGQPAFLSLTRCSLKPVSVPPSVHQTELLS